MEVPLQSTQGLLRATLHNCHSQSSGRAMTYLCLMALPRHTNQYEEVIGMKAFCDFKFVVEGEAFDPALGYHSSLWALSYQPQFSGNSLNNSTTSKWLTFDSHGPISTMSMSSQVGVAGRGRTKVITRENYNRFKQGKTNASRIYNGCRYQGVQWMQVGITKYAGKDYNKCR